MSVTLGWLLILATLPPTIATAQTQRPPERSPTVGAIRVWVDGEQPYHRGDGARVYVHVDDPGHVTILRADTDGRIRVLFPSEPWRQNFVRGGRTLEVGEWQRHPSFTVDEDPGVGYILVVSSSKSFDYDEVTRGDYWDFRLVRDGRIRGDPYVALTNLARRIARDSYQYDITPYYVEQRYDYPRFVCYDCHTYASYRAWDPYATSCARYRMVIYDDPAYYPYRYGKGRNVVTSRPLRPAPRYVFKEAQPGDRYVTRLRQTESHQERRRTMNGDRTSANVGGPSAIPSPNLEAVKPGTFRKRIDTDRTAPERQRPDTPDQPIRARKTGGETAPPKGLHAADPSHKVPPIQRGSRNPQSTGEPELRRRKP
jgi:hypothetical protein